MEVFLKEKIESGEIQPYIALLPREYLKLSDKDWDHVLGLMQEERDEQLSRLEELNKKMFGKT